MFIQDIGCGEANHVIKHLIMGTTPTLDSSDVPTTEDAVTCDKARLKWDATLPSLQGNQMDKYLAEVLK